MLVQVWHALLLGGILLGLNFLILRTEVFRGNKEGKKMLGRRQRRTEESGQENGEVRENKGIDTSRRRQHRRDQSMKKGRLTVLEMLPNYGHCA